MLISVLTWLWWELYPWERGRALKERYHLWWNTYSVSEDCVHSSLLSIVWRRLSPVYKGGYYIYERLINFSKTIQPMFFFFLSYYIISLLFNKLAKHASAIRPFFFVVLSAYNSLGDIPFWFAVLSAYNSLQISFYLTLISPKSLLNCTFQVEPSLLHFTTYHSLSLSIHWLSLFIYLLLPNIMVYKNLFIDLLLFFTLEYKLC